MTNIVQIDIIQILLLLAGVVLNGLALAMAVGDLAVLRDRQLNGFREIIAIGSIRRKLVRWAILLVWIIGVFVFWGIDIGTPVFLARILGAVVVLADATYDVYDRRKLRHLFFNEDRRRRDPGSAKATATAVTPAITTTTVIATETKSTETKTDT